ncbi:flagellar basal body-associated FliL family protein [Oceaniradius stylonematis]|uniref:flagellar basal body-associated FliL family protein n=1 Tax=Oceaniradius stylonematis TaxID=2184161 RepID=UPI00273DF46B|nr:flagellar basal body-associated FliL family protein [Oceaniradius stylonematis]
MADAIADDEPEEEEKGSSPLMAVVFILVAALLAGGVGFGVGQTLFAPMIAGADAPVAQETGPRAPNAADGGHGSDDGYGADEDGHGADSETSLRGLDFASLEVLELEPITTNIGVPSDVWVRMELSLAIEPVDEEEAIDPVMIEAIHADFLAYMRTTRLQSLALPSGFQHMVTDLESRAALRSGGIVKRVFVKALLLE